MSVDFTLRIAVPKFEKSAFASLSEILTSGSAVARAADNAPVALGPWHNHDAWSLYLDCRPIATSGTVTQVLAQLDDGTNNNKAVIRRASSAITAEIVAGGVSQGTLSLGAHTGGTDVKLMLAAAASGMRGRKTGGSEQTSGAITLPQFTTLRLGVGVSLADPGWAHIGEAVMLPFKASSDLMGSRLA